MTHNQIEFQGLKETIRHNQAVERETGRHNVVTEDQGWSGLQETKRHNLVNEDIGYQNITLGYANLNETHRHNVVTEDQGWAGLEYKGREVAAREREVGVKERGQALSEWSAQFIPTDVETRRIQANASMSSANAALQQAGVASALLPYNQNYLSAQSEERRSAAERNLSESNLAKERSVSEVYNQQKMNTESSRNRAEADLARQREASEKQRTYHMEWENQDANLFLEQGDAFTGNVGNLITGGTRAGSYFND